MCHQKVTHTLMEWYNYNIFVIVVFNHSCCYIQVALETYSGQEAYNKNREDQLLASELGTCLPMTTQHNYVGGAS